MTTKQNDAATMTEEQLDTVLGGIILNNDGGRVDRFRPTGQHEIPWWLRPTRQHAYPWWVRVR
jgi:hypothetical protein